MNNYKVAKRIMREMSPEDIVESFVLPVKLTKKQRQEAAKQLAEARKKYKEEAEKKS